MPKLRHPELTKGKAVSYLLDLYRNEPKFVRELDVYDSVRVKGHDLIYRLPTMFWP